MRTARARFGLAVAVAAALTVTISIGVAAASDQGGSPAPSLPLTTSAVTAGGTWVTLDMGKNDGNFDLFWQLFVRRAGATTWTLATPPGVADNGGLILGTGSPSQLDVLAGFAASQGLTFSPLALSGDEGSHWSVGGLDHALVPSPSALAIGPGARALALVATQPTEVLSQSGALTSWTPLVTVDALASHGTMCHPEELEAVAYNPSGSAIVGVACRSRGEVGLFVQKGSTWSTVGVARPASLANEKITVLRLNGTGGLLSAGTNGSRSLLATWAGPSGRAWSISSPLRLGSHESVVASGTGGAQSQFVLLKDGTQLRAEVISGPGGSWRAVTGFPAGTSSIALLGDGELQAFVAEGSELGIFARAPDSGRWERIQSINVPIAYGSSS